MGLTRYTNVVLRGRIYYIRVAVPVDLRAVLGRDEIWKSLRTGDERVARQTATSALANLHADWEYERQRAKAGDRDVPTLGDQAILEIVADFYQSELAADEEFRNQIPTDADLEILHARLRKDARGLDLSGLEEKNVELAVLGLSVDFLAARDAAKLDAERRQKLLLELRKHSAKGETVLVQAAADEALRRRGLAIPRGSREYRRLCQALLRGWIEALDRAAERDEGTWKGAPADPTVAKSIAEQSAAAPSIEAPSIALAADGETIEALFERYASENPRNVKVDTLDQSRKIVALFIEALPSAAFPAAKISKKEVRAWKALLQRYPVKAAEISEFRGKTIAEIVELNKKVGKPTISAKSVNKYLSALAAFCSWLVNHGWLDSNPVDGLLVRYDRDAGPVGPYSIEQLNALFASPLYGGCRSQNEWHLPGGLHFDDHRFWLPPLALFTGARLGELAQLRSDDVRCLHGQWVIHITREGGKSTKTKGSQRVVPIHTELQRLGFVSYVERIRKTGGGRIFPLVGANARGQIGGNYSRSYGKFLQKIGVKTDRELNFHSFRHTFADALRRAGYRDEEFGFLLGHTQASTTGRYGVLSEGALEDRVKLIKAVSYPGLVLPGRRS